MARKSHRADVRPGRSPTCSRAVYPHPIRVDWHVVAPPKRKTGGGRVTPKGTRPGTSSEGQRFENPEENKRGVHSSSRYTPPVPPEMKAPKPWIPVLMLVLLGIGMVIIIVRNLGLIDGNWPLFIGLACFLGGLYTATKWR